MNHQAPQFEREGNPELIAHERINSLSNAEKKILAAIEAQLGPEFDAKAAEIEKPVADEKVLEDYETEFGHEFNSLVDELGSQSTGDTISDIDLAAARDEVNKFFKADNQ